VGNPEMETTPARARDVGVARMVSKIFSGLGEVVFKGNEDKYLPCKIMFKPLKTILTVHLKEFETEYKYFK
jgi:hypothetical protein